MFRIIRAIHRDDVVLQHIYVPYDERARGKVVGAFLSHLLLGRRTVIVFAPDLDGEDRCAVEKLAPLQFATVERCIRAKRAPVG